eukprot:3491641-Alexandrium_andersonii.AAC.1
MLGRRGRADDSSAASFVGRESGGTHVLENSVIWNALNCIVRRPSITRAQNSFDIRPTSPRPGGWARQSVG